MTLSSQSNQQLPLRLHASPTGKISEPRLNGSNRKMVFCLMAGLGLSVLNPANVLSKDPPVIKVDLNGDGAMEKIESKKTSSSDFGDFYQLVVRDAGKKVIWSSPVTDDASQPFAFGSWNIGESLLQAAGDIDGDGAIELVVPAPRSDVSPPRFRIFRWEKQTLVYKFAKNLAGPGKEGGKVGWTESPRDSDFWVEEWMKKGEDGGWEVRMKTHDYKTGKAPQEGTAEIVPKGSSFLLVKWLKGPVVVKE